MQFITFLGTGPAGGEYINSINKFDDFECESKFVQEAIIRNYVDNISVVSIFCTKESKELYSEILYEILSGINKEFNKNIKINFEIIEWDIDFENFIQKLYMVICSNKLIIDTTHSFRVLPTKLLFALNYIESIKDLEIKKIFYGRFDNYSKVTTIINYKDDYNKQKFSYILKQFDETLTINTNDLTENEDLSKLINHMIKFNEIIQLCNFKEIENASKNIVKSSEEIKENSQYYILTALIDKIIYKLDFFRNERLNYKDKMIKFIDLLIETKNYQVAITFIDQLYRVEIIRAIIYPNNYDIEISESFVNKAIGLNENYVIYGFSQAIREKNAGRNYNNSAKYYEIIDKKYKDNYEVLKSNNINVDRFYDKIRNRINHGEMIQVSNLDKELRMILNEIKRI